MAAWIKITPNGRVFLAGHHDSTGILIFAEVGEIAEFLRLPLRGAVGEHKGVKSATFINKTTMYLKVGSQSIKHVVTSDTVMTLKGGLFENARKLGVAIPRMRKVDGRTEDPFAMAV